MQGYANKPEKVLKGEGVEYRTIEKKIERAPKRKQKIEILSDETFEQDGYTKHRQREKKKFDPKDAKSIVLRALADGCDLQTAAGIARVNYRTVKAWWDKDEEFRLDCAYCIESANHELIQKIKKKPDTAWKLLKNNARGRYLDEPAKKDSDNRPAVQLIFNVPRPEHIIPKHDPDKVIDAPKEGPKDE